MKYLIKKILRKPYRFFKILFKVRWLKTIRLNLALLPFDQAIRFPIVVTGKLIIDSLKGEAIIDAPIKFGMILFGKDYDNMPISYCAGRVLIAGKVIFKGYCAISQGANLCVWEKGELELGHCTRVLSGTLLKSTHSIKIGDYSRLTSGCFVMDSNIHFICDVVTGRIDRNFAPIIIGSHCWLTMNTSVTAGAVIPDYCITARGSLINKDFSKICAPGTMLGGSPAKVIKTGVRRLFSERSESIVNQFFIENPNEEYYQGIPGFDEPEEVFIVNEFKL